MTMKVFLTGATGFIGTAVIAQLKGAGHSVLGLTRSEEGAKALQAAGVEVHRGNIEDLDSLRSGAKQADGVIHCGFNHDFSRFLQNCADDHAAIVAMGEVLAGTDKPFVITSGTAIADSVGGKPSTEDGPTTARNPRAASEAAVKELAGRGVNTSVVRLPQVHDPRKQGLVPYVTAVSKEKGVAAYVGDGSNRWPAAHVSDVALLYRLALERAEKGAIYHAVDEEGVTMKAVLETIGKGLGLPVKSLKPEEVEAHYGWLAMFAGLDMPSSSAITRKKLGWEPKGPGLIADLEEGFRS
jgi:nucleoside-diphosphate-sugar epimerase